MYYEIYHIISYETKTMLLNVTKQINNNNVNKTGNGQTMQPYELFMPQCMLGGGWMGLKHKTFLAAWTQENALI